MVYLRGQVIPMTKAVIIANTSIKASRVSTWLVPVEMSQRKTRKNSIEDLVAIFLAKADENASNDFAAWFDSVGCCLDVRSLS